MLRELRDGGERPCVILVRVGRAAALRPLADAAAGIATGHADAAIRHGYRVFQEGFGY